MSVREPTRDECLQAAGLRLAHALRIVRYPASRLRGLALAAEVRGYWRALAEAGVSDAQDTTRQRPQGRNI